MEDFKADLRRQIREIDIATGAAADACLPGLLRRLKHHETRRAKPGLPLLNLYRAWRIHRLSAAVAEARWHVEQGQLARMGSLAGRR